MRPARMKIGGAVAAGWALLATGNAVMAQSPATLPNQDGGWLQWLVGFGVVAVIVLTGFLNPKRSHLT